MSALAHATLRSFRRRLTSATFAGGFVNAAATLAVLAAIALLVVHLTGRPVPRPRWEWSFALLAPLAFGLWWARRQALPPALQAAHLDRQFGLDGLLLTAAETRDAAWTDALEARLRASAGRLPTIRWLPLFGRLAGPLALFAGTCFLPEAPVVVAPTNRPILQALHDLQAELELEKQAGVLPDEKVDDLTARAKQLEQAMEAGKDVDWGDVDALEARLAEERLLQQDGLQKTAAALRALQEAQRNAGAQSASSSAAEQESRMQELLQHAAAAGLLGKLPPNIDPSRAAHAGDAEAFKELAEALAEAAKQDVEAMRGAPGEGFSDEQLDDLAELLEGMGLGEGEKGEGEGDPVAGVGRGGRNRGPGHATLELNENFGGDTSALEAKKLPPGRVLPQDWEVMQTSRTDPDVAPQRNAGEGNGAAAGSGEAAWRRRLAPRHREVVHEFFSGRRAATETKDKR
jgi:hypothetical protein